MTTLVAMAMLCILPSSVGVLPVSAVSSTKSMLSTEKSMELTMTSKVSVAASKASTMSSKASTAAAKASVAAAKASTMSSKASAATAKANTMSSMTPTEKAFYTRANNAAHEAARIISIDTDANDNITTISGSVIFTVNRTNINPNTYFISQLRDSIRHSILSQNVELYKIEVRGAASPEGPTGNNERLAKGRTKVLIDTITSMLPTAVNENIFHTTSITEDYEYLVELMEKSNDPDAKLVRKLYEDWKASPRTLKQILQAEKKGTLWRRLLVTYFPQLRATRIKLYFRPTTTHHNAHPATLATPCRCKGSNVCLCAQNGVPCQCPRPGAQPSRVPLQSGTHELDVAAGTIIFGVNSTGIAPGNAFLNELRGPILQRIKEQHLVLSGIEVRGAASPEGPTNNNLRLAKGRTQTLIDSLTSILPTLDGKAFQTTTVAEDYEYLVQLMREAHDPDAALVDSLCKMWDGKPTDLKWSLMTAKNRTLWKRMLKEYFPTLRATRVKLHFSPDPQYAENGGPAAGPESCQECPCIDKISGEPKDTTTTKQPTDTEIVAPADSTNIGGPIDIIDITEKTDSIPIHRRPVLAVSTNLIYDLWYMPSFGFAPMWNGKVEFYPRRGHFTYALGFMEPYYHKWDEHKFFQIRNYEIEARWYHRFDKETGQRWGWYLGAAIDNNIYGIGLSDTKGWQGEGLGGQITGGFVLPLNKCKSWKLEFNLGFGFYGTRYDPYIYEDPFENSGNIHGEYNPPTINPDEMDKLHYYYKWYGASKDFKLRQWRYRWLGPTQVGISLKYDLLWKRKDRRGVSFRHYEKRKEVRHE